MSLHLREVLRALTGKRLPLEDEKATQAAIGDVFSTEWLCDRFKTGRPFCYPPFEREVRVAGGVIDFLVGGYSGVGVEVKIKGQREVIRRQLRAYAADERIDALVLVTAKPVGVVEFMNGKRVVEFDLGRAWL